MEFKVNRQDVKAFLNDKALPAARGGVERLRNSPKPVQYLAAGAGLGAAISAGLVLNTVIHSSFNLAYVGATFYGIAVLANQLRK